MPFRKKPSTPVVFERLELEPFTAFFRVNTKDSEEYVFSLDTKFEVYEAYVRTDRGFEDLLPDDKVLLSFLREARDLAEDQFQTWGNLSARERISLLLTWGEDQLDRIQNEIRALSLKPNLADHTEELMYLTTDLNVWDQHLSGLETALLTFV